MSPVPSTIGSAAPKRADLQTVPPGPKRSSWPAVIFILVFGAGAAWQFQARRQSKPSIAISVRTVKAVRGNLQRTLRLTGSIAAGTFSNIFAPIVQAPDSGHNGMVLISLATNGAIV